MANEKGVWRTIGGRRVFIKEGQDLASAMKESGKFKSASKGTAKKEMTKEEKVFEDFKNSDGSKENFEKALNKISEMEYNNEINPDEYKDYISKIQKEYVEKNRKANSDGKKLEAYRINEDGKKEMYERTLGDDERGYWTKENGRRVFKENPNYKGEAKEKESGDFESKSEKSVHKEGPNIPELPKNLTKYLDTHKGMDEFPTKVVNGEKLFSISQEEHDMLQNYIDKADSIPEETWRKWGDKEALDVSTRVNNAERVLRNSVIDNKTSNDIMNEKIRSRGKSKVEEDDLPKRTEIKTQGTSNRKEVSDNIQAHILDYYTEDYTGENISPSEAFVRQMDAMGESNMWRAGQKIAEGGSYLIYNGDMADFLDELKINPKGKTFSEDKAFDMYTSLIGRESAKLYDRIQKNSYKKYMKSHPLSKMSFEEFKDMNKK